MRVYVQMAIFHLSCQLLLCTGSFYFLLLPRAVDSFRRVLSNIFLLYRFQRIVLYVIFSCCYILLVATVCRVLRIVVTCILL